MILKDPPDLVGLSICSPNWLINRTFTITVYFPEESQKVEKPRRNYRNPIYLAKEYARMIKNGQAKLEADLARKIGISRVRVNQITRLLKLDITIIEALEQLGDPMPSRIITERLLRNYVGSPLNKQKHIKRFISNKPDECSK